MDPVVDVKVEKSQIKQMASSDIDSKIGPISLEGNLSKNWNSWHQRFKIFLTASNLEKEEDDRKIAILLYNLGEKSLEIFNSFNLNKADQSNYTTVITKFEGYFSPQKNITIERHKFLTRKQLPGESIDSYYTDLVNKSLSCELNALREDLVRDVFICGLNSSNQHLKERLLREPDLTLKKAVGMCKAAELSSLQVRELENTEIAQVSVKNRPKPMSNTTYKQSQQNPTYKSQKPKFKNFINNCRNCGKNHKVNQCPAFGATCFNCKRKNHFASYCQLNPSSGTGNTNRPSQFNPVNTNKAKFSKHNTFNHKKCNEVSLVSENYVNNASNVSDVELGYDNFNIDTITQVNGVSRDWFETIVINNCKIQFKLDSGAQVNLMSYSQFKELGLPNSMIESTDIVITSAFGQKAPVVGSCRLHCLVKDKTYLINFVIIDGPSPALLGLNTCEALCLISRSVNSVSTENINNSPIIKSYHSMFDGNLGTIPGEINLELIDNYEAKIEPPRRVPFALINPLKIELDRMEKLGIITKVTEPTEWVNSMVLINKKGSGLRVVLDPRNLNKFLKRTHCQIPTSEEISNKLAKSKVYSVLDASSAFWMFKLNDRSSRLCTFNTPFARYRFLRMPYGLNCAPDIFQSKMSQLFGDIEGVVTYFDDVCVSGPDQKTHDDRLKKVLEIAKANGIKFNMAKCKIRVDKVKFVGHEYSRYGMSPDVSKVNAIQHMKAPVDRKELERFLGMTNYLSKFIPNYSTITTPLRELLRKDVVFRWDCHQDKAFNQIKSLLVNPPILSYFYPEKDITLSVDSSSTGLGAVLLCDNKPVAYASRALNTSQQNYSQIEKEMCAIHFGCSRFNQYILGRKVTVETDHKPLVSLFRKPLSKCPLRLQTMLLKVQRYDLNVVYKPGKLLFIADTLSRSALPITCTEEIDSTDDDIICQVNLYLKSLPISKEKLALLKSATNKDSTLLKVIHFVRHGWDKNKNNLEPCIKPFWNIRENLHVIDDLLLKNDCIVVPNSLHKEMLVKLHDGHVGAKTMELRARHIIYWPNINADIKQLVNECMTCAKHSPNNSKEPILFHDIPELPWCKVSCDLFEFMSKHYLVVMDYYSKYIELVSITELNSNFIINKLKSFWARHGIPQTLVTDSGTQFTSKEFQNFVSQYEFDHIMTSPKYSQSNGQIESGVKIAKGILSKCHMSNTDLYIALLNYRNTSKSSLPSPAQLLFSRNLNSLLPCSTKNLEPKVTVPNPDLVNKRKCSIQKYYNKHVTPLKELNVSDHVLFKKNPILSSWSPGKIISIDDVPRSYIVEDDKGRLFRRNRKFFILSPQKDQTPQNVNPTTPNKSPGKSPRVNPPTPTNLSPNICQPDNSNNILNESEVVKNMEGYTTSRGRTIKNPKRLSYD